MKRELIIGLILVSSQMMAQTTLYVNSLAGGANNGSNWENAYTNLKDALTSAVFGDSIWVAAGIYKPSENDPSISFELPSGVKMFGGFNGTELALTDRDWELNQPVLSGDLGGFVYSEIIVTCIYPHQTTTLDGFTIEKAVYIDYNNFCNYSNPCSGGEIEVNASPNEIEQGFRFRNCWIRDNWGMHGAGMSVLRDNCNLELVIDHCVFEGNNVVNEGGGLFILGGSQGTVISNSVFRDNSGGNSVGLFLYDFDENTLNSLLLVGCSFFNNSAELGVGAALITAVCNDEAEFITIDSCIFSGNYASPLEPDVPSSAGALYLQNDNLVIPVKIKRCVFKENFASLYGGAVLLITAFSQIENCLFSENRAGEGGAIATINGSIDSSIINMVVVNNTFHANVATENGHSIYTFKSVDSLVNNIFWGHQDIGPISPISGYSTRILAGYNLFDRNNCEEVFPTVSSGNTFLCHGTNLFNIDPQFVDVSAENFQLEYCSPLIDYGDPEIVSFLGIEFDHTSTPRVLNQKPDLGAFENTEFLPSLYLVHIPDHLTHPIRKGLTRSFRSV